jgi:hypothetical protein
MTVKQADQASYYSCDHVAECFGVSRPLYNKLWDLTAAAEEKVPAENCGSSHEHADCNGRLVSQNWAKFTEAEQIELNKVLETNT